MGIGESYSIPLLVLVIRKARGVKIDLWERSRVQISLALGGLQIIKILGTYYVRYC